MSGVKFWRQPLKENIKAPAHLRAQLDIGDSANNYLFKLVQIKSFW